MSARSLAAAFLAIGLAGPAMAQEEGPAEPAVEIGRDTADLPDAVQATRQRILDAARTGGVEELVPVIEMNEMPPSFSFGGSDDPVEMWKDASGDGEGREILAILVELLEGGYAHVDPGGAQEMYVWPYFHALPVEGLTPEQEVDLYQLVSPEEFQQMKDFGAYTHYRIGIGPDGTWHYFVAGD